jgi:Ca-activated chloride channel family protein
MGPNTKKLMPIVLVLTLLVAACGGGDDAGTSFSDGDVADEGLMGGDGALDTGDDAMDEEQSAEALADAPAERIAATGESSEGAGDADAAAAPGGLFAPDGEVDDSDRREEDNTFADYGIRPFVSTSVDPLSTFALDVDTASYAVARRWIEEGVMPPPEAVRLEEFVNSFSYDYRAPRNGLGVVADAGPSPFTDGNIILRLGVQAENVPNAERPPASLTFIIDTSGSMDRGDRLELVKTSLERLVIELDRNDSVAIVTYSDSAQVLLPPTSVADEEAILDVIRDLRTDGSTNLEAGLQRGYDLANESFIEGGINRVVLASDGVANVGLVDPDGLVSLIRGDADKGIQLVTIGVGMGNFNDVTMEQLANDGDGFYAYVDTVAEAEKLFADELVSTLLTVAIDGKIQVEFDPDTVSQYRLLGFENRAVLDDDFRNDAVDAGELGAGHQVTALYELTLHGSVAASDPLGTVQLRWEDPDTRSVVETRLELAGSILQPRWTETADDFRLAVTVAALAEVLRESPYVGDVTLAQIAAEADALAPDSGEVGQLSDLIRRLLELG